VPPSGSPPYGVRLRLRASHPFGPSRRLTQKLIHRGKPISIGPFCAETLHATSLQAYCISFFIFHIAPAERHLRRNEQHPHTQSPSGVTSLPTKRPCLRHLIFYRAKNCTDVACNVSHIADRPQSHAGAPQSRRDCMFIAMHNTP
jgi:hypothetical protein